MKRPSAALQMNAAFNMSIRTMTQVWKFSRLGGTELLCLIAIADFVNETSGVAFPSVTTLAAKMRMSERNTHYLLKKLEQSGELEIERNAGPKGCNLYRVKILQGADFARVQPIAEKGATDSSHVVQSIAPEPLLNHKEPLTALSPSKQAVEILTYLNEKAKRKYSPVKANLSLIVARIKESTFDECKAVIDAKVVAWGNDPKMSEYLRPKTLFSAINFAQYVGELGSTSTDVPVWERT